MRMNIMMISALAALTAGGVAQAQQTNPPVVDMPIGAQTGQLTPKAESALPGSPQVAPVPASADVAVKADITDKPGETSPYVNPTAQMIASAPVPDTAANRQMYRPMSRAGRASSATGN